MSVETKLPRLLAAAKEFNIGQDTLVEFLAGKGFSRDELKPTARLTASMYEALQKEFQSDKVAKAKSDAIDLPRGALVESRKRREEEEISFRKEKDDKKALHDRDKEVISEIKAEKVAQAPPSPASVPEVAPVPEPIPVIAEKTKETPVEVPIEPAQAIPAIEVLPEPAPKPEAVIGKAEDLVVEAPVAPEKQPEAPQQKANAKPITNEAPAQEAVEEKVSAEPEIIRLEAPEIEGPKVIAKIDLSAIDSSTRPKKGTAQRPEKPAPSQPRTEKPQPAAAPPPIQTVAAKPAVETPAATAAEQPQPEEVVISNLPAERLAGPKIVGRIQLPVDNDTRPKGPAEREKRKRNRIPVARHQNQQGGGASIKPSHQQGGQNQPGANTQGGGNRNQQGGQNKQHGDNRSQHDRNKGFGRGDGNRKEDKIIDEKEIQRKLQETQARLSGSNRPGKGLKAKARRDKRRELAEAQQEGVQNNLLEVTEFISVSELAALMNVNFAEVISKCMGLGIMVSINQRLDAEVIELVASEFGFDVKFVGLEDQELDEEDEEVDDEENLKPRAPIVTIMGHVDHGKTSLLDYIRNANVVSGEAGGITQHIGAYEVTASSGKKITFLDTPGHEAFTAMRARGAKVTDIAVIVIAADDAVMPQTKEAISHAQAANVPMIFAINKIDKEGANPQKIYEQLANMNLLVEEWGGKYQSQEISAKKGINIDLLLEKILLEAELLELKANPNRQAVGTVLEASLDKGRGYVATVLVQNGTLKVGDVVVSGQYFGRVKAMFNERNERIESAGPSSPAQLLGLNGAPQAGEKFKVFEDEAEAKQVAYKRGQILREQGMRTRKHITLDEIGRRLALGNFKELNVIIKGDVDGSVEALSDSLQKLSTEEIVVNVILKGVGAISENDVTLASASDAIIIGFNVRPNLQASRLAEQEGIQIKQYSIIYNAIADVKSAMEGLLEPKIEEKEVATVEIRQVYKFDKITVAGCFVLEGRLKRDAKIRLYRDGVLIYPRTEGAFAELGSLKRYKDDVKEVVNNYECGLTIKNFSDIQVGDTIVAFEEEEVKRTL
jgi:translation initiation factor IF-2